jgi:hypothetical protein
MQFRKNYDIDLRTTEWNISPLSTISLGSQYRELYNNIKLNNKNSTYTWKREVFLSQF